MHDLKIMMTYANSLISDHTCILSVIYSNLNFVFLSQLHHPKFVIGKDHCNEPLIRKFIVMALVTYSPAVICGEVPVITV